MRVRFNAAGAGNTDWIVLSSTGSFTASAIEYCRRGSEVYVEMAGTVSGALAAGTALSAALPASLCPSRQVIRQVNGSGTLRGVYINTDGIIRVDFGATGAGAGFFGGFSFPI